MDGIGKGFALAVFEVFMQHLIAADVIVPKLGGDALEVLVRVDLHDTLILILDEFHQIIRTATLILCYGSVQARTFQKMNVSKLFTISCKQAEQLVIICKRYAGEIHPEILGKARAVLIAVQDGIDVIK